MLVNGRLTKCGRPVAASSAPIAPRIGPASQLVPAICPPKV